MDKRFEHLLSPMTIGKTIFKNRMCVAPMGAGYGNRQGPHGEYMDSAIEYMIERAKGGFGLFYVGSIYPDYKVDPHDPASHFMLHKVDFKKMALRMTERAKVYDMKMIQQLSFGTGRNNPGQYSCSPLPVFGKPDMIAPVLTKDQIKQKIDCMVEGAALMKECGFYGVEMHAMHWGYLLDQFAMSITNHREDEYGGSLENRMRIAKELAQGIKQVCGDDFLVGMRLGLKSYLTDFNTGSLTGENEAGRTLEEGIRISQMLEAYGYDMLSVDVGVYESWFQGCPPSHMPLGNVIPLAAEVKKNISIPVLCGSRMNDPFLTEQAIAEGKIDGAVLGRPSLADPYYVKKLEMGQPEKIRPCIGCLVGCMDKINNGQFMACAVNPQLLKESQYGLSPALVPKKVAVIGGGVAGMEAARICKMRGHDVTIYEKSNRLGGLLYAAGAPSFKKETRQLMNWYIDEVESLKIPVVYGADMNAETVKALNPKPEVVILAMGSGSLMPKSIAGIDHPKCASFIDAHENKEAHKDDQKVVVFGGGLVGCETALDFAMDGKEVTLVEAAPNILSAGKKPPIMITQMMPLMLAQYNVRIMTGYQIDAINDTGAVVSPTGGGESEALTADRVIIAIGRKRAANFALDIYGNGLEVYSCGDIDQVGNVYTCITSAYEIARRV